MEDKVKHQVKSLLDRAKRDYKGDYRVYTAYRRELESLDMSPKEFQLVIRKLSKALEV